MSAIQKVADVRGECDYDPGGDLPALEDGFSKTCGYKKDNVINKSELARMKEYVDKRIDKKYIVKTLKLPSGDLVDCVDVYKQPAMMRKGMEKHEIQFRPASIPGELKETDKDRNQDTFYKAQEYGGESEICPEKTVPITHITLETLKRFKTLNDFLKKTPPRDGPTSLHQYAKADKYVDNWGGESVFNVWKPYTERSDEFTLSQMWVVRGSGDNKETVEGGWQKYKDLYGDWNSRLFIYFTPDNYGSGGCYNLSCGAFVQVNNSVHIGGKFGNYSSHDGAQYVFKMLWYKDGENGHWWLKYGDTWVGYYPRSLFDGNGLRDHAARTSFGGEIINRDENSQHTRTDMGSGYMPSYGFGWAAYQRSIRYVDTSNFYRQASGMSTYVSDSYCYDIDLKNSSGSWEQYFYFGGWGYNSLCE
jgi:hypothetical protein